MKINVVKDKSGKVVATFETSSDTAAALTPVLNQGEKVEQLEVAEDYKEKLHTLYSANGK